MKNELNTTNTNTTRFYLFIYFKNLHVLKKKNQICILRKLPISFNLRKFRSATNEDANPFYFEEKFRSTSKKDTDPFYFEEKRIDYMQIFKTKKQIISTVKESRTYFHELN